MNLKFNNISQERKVTLLQIIFVTSIILANIVGIKIINVFSLDVSMGIWLVPITFLITDVLAEVKGRKFVGNLIWSTAIALVFSFLFIQLSIIINPAERFVDNNPAFIIIFKNSARMFIASVIAFIISQFHDLWAFDFWKNKTKGKYLWLRNNLSTIVSQFIDTTIFIFIAFYQVSPAFDFAFMWKLILPYYTLKVVLAVIDTPFVYLGVRWLKEKKYA